MNKYYVVSNFGKAPKIVYGQVYSYILTGMYVEHERRAPIPQSKKRYIRDVLILSGPYDTYKEAYANTIIKSINFTKYVGQC